MLEKPDLPDELIISCLQTEYGLHVSQLTFLPLGADVNTAVYRVVAKDETAYFLKLRKGAFDEIAVTIPQFVKSQGIQAIIAPLETKARQLWANLDACKMILYPFIDGKNGYELALSDRQWLDFGSALKGIHSTKIPSELLRLLPREVYSPRWRDMVKQFQVQAEEISSDDPTAAKLAAFMQSKRSEISHIVERAEQLGLALQSRALEMVLCHSDIHPGNLLITADGALYIVDWDQPILAPRERDLLLVGGSPSWNDPREIALFYQGYGPSDVDRMALAYYRYERIIWDLAAECELLFLSTAGGDNREQEYDYFVSNFLPGHEIELARKADA